jgi:hypothetical protein
MTALNPQAAVLSAAMIPESMITAFGNADSIIHPPDIKMPCL